MNSGRNGSNGNREISHHEQADERLDAWRGLLASCGRKPSKKRVHALRVVTLRILAKLEHETGENGAGGPFADAAGRWIKLGDKLRHALGPVREVDVWLDKLDGLHDSLADTNGHSPRTNRAWLGQIEELRKRLEKKRRQWARKLVSEIVGRRERLEGVSQELLPLANQPDGAAGVKHSGVDASEITEQFAGIVAEFPSLDAGNLHEFRKSIKRVRYLSEMVASGDPEVARKAASLKKIQSAIGEWHDWDALAKRAAHAHGKHKELTELLQTLASESLEKALEVCGRLTESLLARRNAETESLMVPPKKPPVRVVEFAAPSLRKSA